MCSWGYALIRSGLALHRQSIHSLCVMCLPLLGQRGPEVVLLAKWLFGGLGCQGQKSTPFQENNACLALPPSAARPKNHYVPKQVWFFGLGTPGLQKNTWPKKHVGITLTQPLKKPHWSRAVVVSTTTMLCRTKMACRQVPQTA